MRILRTALIMAAALCGSAVSGGGGGGGTGGGPGPGPIAGTDTIPDTLYYQSDHFSPTERIYSITNYNADRTVRKYTVFFVTGQTSYYGLYEYVTGQIVKESYFDASNQLTSYGAYTSNAIGWKDYQYFTKDGVLLSTSQYSSAYALPDSTHQCVKYTLFTTSGMVRSITTYQYSADGWLLREHYLDHSGDSLGSATWGWDPLTQVTAYIYKCKPGHRLFNDVEGVWYNQYRTYYHGVSVSPDSLKVYNADTLVYTARYEYDSRRWLVRDRYSNSRGAATAHGEYAFDKVTSQTTYRYYKEPAELLFETSYDYRHYYISSTYYSGGLISYRVNYLYNSAGLWSKLTKSSPQGALLSCETYTYYQPYDFLQRFATFDAKDSCTSYFNYNEFGEVTDSAAFRAPVGAMRMPAPNVRGGSKDLLGGGSRAPAQGIGVVSSLDILDPAGRLVGRVGAGGRSGSGPARAHLAAGSYACRAEGAGHVRHAAVVAVK